MKERWPEKANIEVGGIDIGGLTTDEFRRSLEALPEIDAVKECFRELSIKADIQDQLGNERWRSYYRVAKDVLLSRGVKISFGQIIEPSESSGH